MWRYAPELPLLWDDGYATAYQDLEFLCAAVLVGAIVSKPIQHLLCLNLGHKSVAAEMDFPRLKLLNVDRCTQISHSEEHLVVECEGSAKYPVGTVCYAVPTHICPTVLKYDHAHTVRNGKIDGRWEIAARDHIISL